MRLKQRVLCCFLALITVLSCLVFPASAAGDKDGTHTTRKIVSVLYDNSGSMNDPVVTGSANPVQKNPYARYALQMLLSMLGTDDTLVITPLNKKDKYDRTSAVNSVSNSITVDLSKKNRSDEILSALSNDLLKNPNGGTPGPSPLGVAMQHLTNQGLREEVDISSKEDETEYWLVILSDGAFNDDGNSYLVSAQELLKPYITKYPVMNTIFIGFGSGAPKSADFGQLVGNYPFRVYDADSSEKLINDMQEIANLLSSRCKLEDTDYSVQGNKVVLDLDKFKYSIKSVSLIAQDCGATLKSATYNGKSLSIAQPCVIKAESITVDDKGTLMKDGYSAIVKDAGYLYGGKLELEFSAPVKRLSIMTEPALRVSAYFECNIGGKWERISVQEINATKLGGDKVRAGYEAFEQTTGQPVDIEELFGSTTTSVTYAGNSYKVGEEFALVTGDEVAVVTVSVLNGSYTVQAELACKVLESLDDYRVDVVANDQSKPGLMKADFEYTVIVDKKPLTKAEMSNYKCSAVLKGPDGKESQLKVSIGSDGKAKVSVNESSGAYGDYEVLFTVVDPDNLSRTGKSAISLCPEELKIEIKGQNPISVTQHGILSNTTPFTFELTAGGKAFDFSNDIITYKLEFDEKDVTGYATVAENTITYVPKAEHMSSISNGSKKVTLSVNSDKFPTVSISKFAELIVGDIKYDIQAVDSGKKEVDRFNINKSGAVLYFKVIRDGALLAADELRAGLDAGEFKFGGDGLFTWQFWLPVGYSADVAEVNGEPVVEYRVVRKWYNIIPVNFMSMFIFGGDKTVEVEYRGASASDFVTFTPSNIVEYIWRVLLFIFLLFLVSWVVGFFNGHAKNLPTGMFITISDFNQPDAYFAVKYVNIGFKEKWLWHIKRFHKIFIWGHQEEVRAFGTIKYGFTKDGKATFSFRGDNIVEANIKDGKPKWKPVQEYIDKCKKAYRKNGEKGVRSISKALELHGPDMKTLFQATKTKIDPKYIYNASNRAYGVLDDNGTLESVIFFVKL